MLLLAGGVVLAGYTLLYWGVTQVQGCTNVGLAQVIWPGKWKGCDKSGSPASSSSAGSSTSSSSSTAGASGGGSAHTSRRSVI